MVYNVAMSILIIGQYVFAAGGFGAIFAAFYFFLAAEAAYPKDEFIAEGLSIERGHQRFIRMKSLHGRADYNFLLSMCFAMISIAFHGCLALLMQGVRSF